MDMSSASVRGSPGDELRNVVERERRDEAYRGHLADRNRDKRPNRLQ